MIDPMDRRPLWRYYLLVNDEKCHVWMYVKMDILSRNDMQWIMMMILTRKRLVRGRDIFPMVCLYRGRYLGKPLRFLFDFFQSCC